jgi:hypothetical protein
MEASRFRTRYAGIILLTLITLTLAPISASYAKNQDERFKTFAEQARGKVDELGAHIGDAFDPAKIWPDYLDEEDFGEIKAALDAADSEFNAENYKEAMKAYREVYRMLNMYAEAEGLTLEKGVGERARGLLVAIDRANESIARIKDANDTYFELKPLTEDDPREIIITWINANITYAEGNLTEAYESITVHNNAGWAEGNLTEARQNISDAFAALKSLSEWTNAWRIESFLMGIRNSVERTREMLQRAKGQDVEVDDLLGQLDSVEDDINSARNERARENTRAAIGYLKAIREKLRNVHRGLAQQRKGGKQ